MSLAVPPHPQQRQKLFVEVAQRRKSILKHDEVFKLIWTDYLTSLPPSVAPHCVNYPEPKHGETIKDIASNIESITVSNHFNMPLTQDKVEIFVFRINESGHDAQTIKSNGINGEADEQTPASNRWLLPAREYHGLWDSLHFEPNVKENLLKFVETSMLFSARNIDQHVISCNRLVLLHGPPGTGKTSLCKAIAQKLSIRLANSYRFTHLIEINSHSLFSKWFSESGKLVMKLFDDIKKTLDHNSSLVCLLIDEVESIAFARSSVSANEPSDSLRVVNAVLTQLDQIRHRPNLLVLTTSNLTATIDVAFMDRADIKQYIGHPTVEAIYAIYLSAIRELMRAGIIIYSGMDDGELMEYDEARMNTFDDAKSSQQSRRLIQLSVDSVGLSGRTLRKLPFLAHALHLHNEIVSLSEFLIALQAALKRHRSDTKQLNPIASNGRV